MPKSLMLFLAMAVLAGCDRPDEGLRARQLAARALRNMLAYPQSSLVSVTAGEDAAELVLSSPASVPQIAAWYRQTLRLNQWELKSERVRHDTVTLYAERQGEPVWITLRPNTGAPGTTYSLVGAILADTTTTPRAAADS
jgi:hypothetical protein